jgi:hypothetical protein
MFLFLFVALLQGPAPAIQMKTIDAGTQSQIEQPEQVTARSAEDWAKLWRQHSWDREAPAVDFARDMVVGVFLGGRPTAGFGIQIVCAREEHGALVVQYRRRGRQAVRSRHRYQSPYQPDASQRTEIGLKKKSNKGGLSGRLVGVGGPNEVACFLLLRWRRASFSPRRARRRPWAHRAS